MGNVVLCTQSTHYANREDWHARVSREFGRLSGERQAASHHPSWRDVRLLYTRAEAEPQGGSRSDARRRKGTRRHDCHLGRVRGRTYARVQGDPSNQPRENAEWQVKRSYSTPTSSSALYSASASGAYS